MSKGRKMAAAAATVFMLALGALMTPAPASAETLLGDELTEEVGSTTTLGGGDHFFVKYGNDAAFGIVWGTEEVENNVYFVVIKTRYLGLAQVYDSDGDILEEDHAITVKTMYAVKLDSIIEFDDADGNGVLQYQRAFNDVAGNFSETYTGPETTYKKVDLNTAWSASDVEFVENDGDMSWSFDLSAGNLSYTMLYENATEEVGDQVLNNLTLSFNLEASKAQVDNASLPQWRITVTTGPLGALTFIYPERLDDMQVNGNVIKYDVKWDQVIDGWDFDPANENPMLLMEMHGIVGHFLTPLMAKWMNMRTLSHMNAVGAMEADSTQGTVEVNETTGELPSVKKLTATKLTFGSDWTKIGVLTWVDDVTVDGEPEKVTAQIMAGHRVLAFGDEPYVRFEGFVTLTGLTFPGGALVVHDPTFSADVLVDFDLAEDRKIPVTLIGIAAAMAIIVIVAIAILVTSGDKPKKGLKDGYDKGRSSRPGEWERYYNKK
ncbi:MAG: hypothetical protein JSV90_04925 [Methanobacteriota archaeon]|nr:MAG: hypothetical protein JSV90_04925 [Euryarchaeota archaeon]